MRGVLVFLLVAHAVAHADSATPWADGIPHEQQAQANEVFAQANQLFAKQAYTEALGKYEAAIARWDHPMIRFNMAVTLIRLDRYLQAADALDKALHYGAAPFTPELYQQAMDYQKLVAGRVAWIEPSCRQPGARVAIDGKPVFNCPATQRIRVLAGEHQIVAEAEGYMPLTRRVVVAGGATARVPLDLIPVDSVTLEYPVRRWLPWSVAGAGGAIALGGLAFWISGKSQMDRFDREYAIECAASCESDLSQHRALRDQRDGALLKNGIGVTMIAIGGAAIAGGVIWAVLNRPHRVLPRLELQPVTGGASVHLEGTF